MLANQCSRHHRKAKRFCRSADFTAFAAETASRKAIASRKRVSLMILLNLFFDGGKANLVFRTKAGKRILTEAYHPHFFALCDEPEEKSWLISQHPAVISASIESGAVKVATAMADFRKVIADVRKMSGVRELAETAVPHHLRYASGKGLVFFKEYDDALRPAAGGDELSCLSSLRLGVAMRDGSGFRIIDESGKDAQLGLLDVLFSDGGDSFLQHAPGAIASPAGVLFRDVIHIDVRKDMAHDIYDESAAKDIFELGRERLIRVMELSYMTGAKPDLVPRITAGKLNVYLHMAAAKRMGLVIPDRKKQLEMPKTLSLLLKMDKGGTIFYPVPGVYEGVAKCDFASMYPNIIVKRNISPETMHCSCGDDEVVPVAGWTICRKKGLIPRGLEAVLERRLALKRLMKAEREPERRRVYDLRQRALKNILVTCFGYLGFKNFIFSNVECKECVMLYGRLVLERAREIALEEGLEVVYGMVDSIFVRGGSRGDYLRYVSRVGRETGFELELDCVFSRIAFPSGGDGSGVANKYYGITDDGAIEARGIAIRHSDSPAFIKEFQERAIRELLSGGFHPERLGALVEGYERMLRDGSFGIGSLAITKSVRRERYRTRQAHAIAYALAGGSGGAVTFVFTRDGPKPLSLAYEEAPDLAAYVRLLRQAAGELVIGISPELYPSF